MTGSVRRRELSALWFVRSPSMRRGRQMRRASSEYLTGTGTAGRSLARNGSMADVRAPWRSVRHSAAPPRGLCAASRASRFGISKSPLEIAGSSPVGGPEMASSRRIGRSPGRPSGRPSREYGLRPIRHRAAVQSRRASRSSSCAPARASPGDRGRDPGRTDGAAHRLGGGPVRRAYGTINHSGGTNNGKLLVGRLARLLPMTRVRRPASIAAARP